MIGLRNIYEFIYPIEDSSQFCILICGDSLSNGISDEFISWQRRLCQALGII